jgi:glycosyltransferase involved in cell wall biosynthesis
MQIVGNVDEKSLDIAVVIPAYNEGAQIARSLESIATQQSLNDMSVAVFVVVNNSRDAAEEVVRANKETIGLISLVQGKVPEVDLDMDMEIHVLDHLEARSSTLAQQCQVITQSRLNVVLVDLSSPENAPLECNVGYARDIGVKAARPYLKDDSSIYAITDADTTYSATYLVDVLTTFELNPDVSIAKGASGTVLVVSGNDIDETEKLVTNLRASEQIGVEQVLNQLLVNMYYLFNDIEVPYSRYSSVGGANIIARASLVDSLDGFQRIPGGEDTDFGIRAASLGFEVQYIESIGVVTDDRASERTDPDSGWGQQISARLDSDHDLSKRFVYGANVSFFYLKIYRVINEANDMYFNQEISCREDWIEYVLTNCPELNSDDVSKLWIENIKQRDNLAEHNRFIYRLLKKEVVPRLFHKVTLLDFVEEAERLLVSELESSSLPEHAFMRAMFSQAEGFIQRHVRKLTIVKGAFESDEHDLEKPRLQGALVLPHNKSDLNSEAIKARIRRLSYIDSMLVDCKLIRDLLELLSSLEDKARESGVEDLEERLRRINVVKKACIGLLNRIIQFHAGFLPIDIQHPYNSFSLYDEISKYSKKLAIEYSKIDNIVAKEFLRSMYVKFSSWGSNRQNAFDIYGEREQFWSDLFEDLPDVSDQERESFYKMMNKAVVIFDALETVRDNFFKEYSTGKLFRLIISGRI